MTPPKNKKYPNFQDLYSFEDYKKAIMARSTFNCGISPVCLLAPDQHKTIHQDVVKGREAASAGLEIRTLKLEYAIQVWLRAALVSADNPGPLLYYWWLHYESNETSFRELKYSNFYRNVTPEQMVDGFWKLLEDIANSGEIKVHEGYSYSIRTGKYITDPKIDFTAVLNIDKVGQAHKGFGDIFSYQYDQTPRSYTWDQIRPMFTQLTLKQISLLDREQLHKHSAIDDLLFKACGRLDIEGVKRAITRGADVNALDERGESALQHAVEYFNDNGVEMDKKYSDEEMAKIEKENYDKCVEIVDYLLECGADIDLFGEDGMQPLTCAYYTHSVDMVRHLLEKGSNPNYNSYRCDDVHYYDDDKNRCTVLSVIDDDLSEEYDDKEQEIEKLVHDAGGRLYHWDYDPGKYERIGKYYVRMSPTSDEYLFFDNGRWGIGNEEKITIEDEFANQSEVPLGSIPGLKDWHDEYSLNINAVGFDWGEWNRRGKKLAQEVAECLPNTVALFYPYGDTIERKWDNWSKRYYIEQERESIRIK